MDFKSIIVSIGNKGVTIVDNPTSYPMIGKGKHGAVFKISPDRCVKIFVKQERFINESLVFKVAQESPIVPRLFDIGTNSIVMEYIDGPSLDQFLASKGFLPEDITKKILLMLKEMKRLNFTRLDARLRHILVTKQEELKVIDHANSFIKIDPVPIQLFKGLKKLGLFSSFLEQVKHADPDSYMEWINYLEDFSFITVNRGELVIYNPTLYPLIGKGKQGAVFKLTEDRCVKIYLKPKDMEIEKEAMLKCQGMSFMPKFYESGPNYIIMEYIDGTPFRDYLIEQGTISESISQQLVNMKKEMKRLGFTNLDIHVNRHIFVDKHNVVKVIDHASSYDWHPIPVRLLYTLSKLGLIDLFMQRLKVWDSELYSEWNNFLSSKVSEGKG